MNRNSLSSRLCIYPLLILFIYAGRAADQAATPAAAIPVAETGLIYIETGFENASPVWYEVSPDGAILIHLLYDHEYAAPNRAAGHIHFLLHGKPGARLTLEFRNLDNIWNGRPGSVARELKSLAVSADGKLWKGIPTESLPGDRVRVTITMPGPKLYLARLEPYRLSDLEGLLTRIRRNRRVEIETIGRTVEGRNLEIVHIGKAKAPHRVFLRARAHPWESGGNWVVEGLIERLLQKDAEVEKFLKRYHVSILPLANKDGVAHGMTRFNRKGKDLNRNWDKPADPTTAPENAALERWLEKEIRAGRRPHLALELHNDGNGALHISRPDVPDLARYLDRMASLESLLRRHTWFTEGSSQASFRNPGSFGEGWLERYGIDAVVHEFHCNWIAGLKDYPSAAHWREYGRRLARVFYDYFEDSLPTEARSPRSENRR